jgi:nucleoside-diphosphate-sugar epimerase
VVIRLAEVPDAFGNIWHLAGAGVTSQREVIAEMERQTGRGVKVRVAGKLVLRLIGLFNPLVRELVEMNYLMTDPLIMDDSALQRLIGPIRKTSYVEGIRQTLAALRAAGNEVPAQVA